MKERIKIIDGLRGISILLVIANHVVNAKFLHHANNPLLFIFSNGALGVFMFFVISGYLITNILKSNYNRNGEIDFYSFYKKRAIKILPPLYFYIAVISLFQYYFGYPVSFQSIIKSSLFLQNIIPWENSWVFQHTWSLAVEEQFYIIWPAILFICLRYYGNVTAVFFCVALIILAPIFRASLYVLAHDSFWGEHISILLPSRIDAMMFGCLISLASGLSFFENVYNKISRYIYICPIIFFGISGYLTQKFGNYYSLSVGQTIDGLCFSFFLIWSIRNNNSLVASLMSNKLFTRIGVTSYSIYIWQTYILHNEGPIINTSIILSILLVFVAGELSYNIIELNFNKLRNSRVIFKK